MGLVERLEELNHLRLEGRLSDTEYATLVSAATMDAKGIGSSNPQSEIASPPQDDLSSITVGVPLNGVDDSASRKIPLRSLLVGGIVIVAVIILFVVTRPGSPTESSEYKQLLQSQSDLNSEIKDLNSEIKDLNSKLVDIAPIQAEFDDYSKLIERHNVILRDLESIS